jgi:hypothetical protein
VTNASICRSNYNKSARAGSKIISAFRNLSSVESRKLVVTPQFKRIIVKAHNLTSHTAISAEGIENNILVKENCSLIGKRIVDNEIAITTPSILA